MAEKLTFPQPATASVQIFDSDLEFGVAALRMRRDKGTAAEYLGLAKIDAVAVYPDAKLESEKRATVDNQDALELRIIVKEKTPVICRVVRSPKADYGFEIFVSGARVDEHREDIDRFFNSFKFKR